MQRKKMASKRKKEKNKVGERKDMKIKKEWMKERIQGKINNQDKKNKM